MNPDDQKVWLRGDSYQTLQQASGPGDHDHQLPDQLRHEGHLHALRALVGLETQDLTLLTRYSGHTQDLPLLPRYSGLFTMSTAIQDLY